MILDSLMKGVRMFSYIALSGHTGDFPLSGSLGFLFSFQDSAEQTSDYLKNKGVLLQSSRPAFSLKGRFSAMTSTMCFKDIKPIIQWG